MSSELTFIQRVRKAAIDEKACREAGHQADLKLVNDVRDTLVKAGRKADADVRDEMVAEIVASIARIPDAELSTMLGKPVYAAHLPKIKAEIARRAAGRKADVELAMELSERAGTMATSTLERLAKEDAPAIRLIAQDELRRRCSA